MVLHLSYVEMNCEKSVNTSWKQRSLLGQVIGSRSEYSKDERIDHAKPVPDISMWSYGYSMAFLRGSE